MEDEDNYSDQFESQSAKSEAKYSENRDFKDFSENKQLFAHTEKYEELIVPEKSPSIQPMPQFTPDQATIDDEAMNEQEHYVLPEPTTIFSRRINHAPVQPIYTSSNIRSLSRKKKKPEKLKQIDKEDLYEERLKIHKVNRSLINE
jgi:hypothetical protein